MMLFIKMNSFRLLVLVAGETRIFFTGGYHEIAQKAIEGANIICQNMLVILRWLKIRTI